MFYEYPFNEQIRTLLRLEDLYERFAYFKDQEHSFEHHAALLTLFEILEVAARADLKSDLMQELERQRQMLTAFKNNPNVKSDTLDLVLLEIDQIISKLVKIHGKAGQHLRDNEWLMSLRGRLIIPGGACEFDLPSYYAWQQRPAPQRQQDLNNWFLPMSPLFDALRLVLRILRESGNTVRVIAQGGQYQQSLQGKMYQMLRLELNQGEGIPAAIPEISANKYMLWVRFTIQDNDVKPRTFEADTPFELTLCNF